MYDDAPEELVHDALQDAIWRESSLGMPILGTEERIECDTLMLSVGLIPENEVSKGAGIDFDSITSGAVVDNFRQTSKAGIFACGNVLHVHDLVDFVSMESELAGRSAAKYVTEGISESMKGETVPSGGIRYVYL